MGIAPQSEPSFNPLRIYMPLLFSFGVCRGRFKNIPECPLFPCFFLPFCGLTLQG
jgi:hypothetical protein